MDALPRLHEHGGRAGRVHLIDVGDGENVRSYMPMRQVGTMIEQLTPCELRVLELVCEGWSNREIAHQLRVRLPTVKFHVYQIFGKLGAARRTQAVALAVHRRLVHPAWLQDPVSAAAPRMEGATQRAPT